MDTKLNIASCKETNTEQVPGMAYVPWQQFTRTYDPNRALRAFALCSERLRIWSATTANPLPASPALAASIAAFKERRLVWLAISSISEIIFSICFDVSLIRAMTSTRKGFGCHRWCKAWRHRIDICRLCNRPPWKSTDWKQELLYV